MASNRLTDAFRRYRWLYLLGWLFLTLLALVGKSLGPAVQGLNDIVGPLAPSPSVVWRILFTVVALVVGPLVAGSLAQVLLHVFQGRRRVDALLQMQKKLFGELDPDSEGGFRVAILAWPSPDVRTIALITSTFEDSETGRQLASVFIPNTPDPTSGTMKVIALEDLSVIGWTFKDIASFHRTFGSVSPPASGAQR